MSYERKLLPLDGSTISLVDVGSGPAVILGSGFLCDADSWTPQIDALSAHYRVIVPELWGHGLSGPLPDGTSLISDVARHYLGLLDVLKVQQCAVIRRIDGRHVGCGTGAAGTRTRRRSGPARHLARGRAGRLAHCLFGITRDR